MDCQTAAFNQQCRCCCPAQVRGYLPLDPNVAPTPQLVAASQALKLQELASRKQELLFELQGYSVNRAAGQPASENCFKPSTFTCARTSDILLSCRLWLACCFSPAAASWLSFMHPRCFA